jgi:hypothetical protein
MASFKIQYSGQIRRIHLDDPTAFSFQELKATSLRLFQISPQETVSFTYVDEQGDRITLAEDSDLQEAFRVSPTLKITVESQSKNPSGACWPCGPCGPCPRGGRFRALPLMLGLASLFCVFGCRGSSLIGILIAAGAVGFHLAKKNEHQRLNFPRPSAPPQEEPAAPSPERPLYPNLSAEILRSKLETLKEMGFTDAEKNIRLLLDNNGDVPTVVRHLL